MWSLVILIMQLVIVVANAIELKRIIKLLLIGTQMDINLFRVNCIEDLMLPIRSNNSLLRVLIIGPTMVKVMDKVIHETVLEK